MSWVGDAVNAVGEGASKITGAVERGAGELVEHGSALTGDALEAVGLDDAGQAVRSAGADAAGALGAHVDERQLGETEDPKELIHGDVEKINETASHLKDFSAAFDRVADGMRKIGSGQHWSGTAADAFREAFDMHPKQWMHAADACGDASKALKSYAETVSWAQGKAADAIDKYRKALEATRQALDAYKTKVDTYNTQVDTYNAAIDGGQDPGTKPQKPVVYEDPGAEGRETAQEMLKSARAQRNEAAGRARNAIKGALAHAPQKPTWLESAGANLKDGGEAFVLQNAHMVGGALKAAADTVKLGRKLNPLDTYNITHPWQYLSNTSTTLMGLAQAPLHPIDTAKGVLGSGWGSDPGDAWGALILNAVGSKGAGGLAKGAAKAGAKNITEGWARHAAENGGKITIRDRARIAWCKIFGSDPIDMATGRMILPQTDIALPGSLPLSFTRTFESSYRQGRWFGPTWMSTVDQRLEIDAEGVILIGEEGDFLLYPHPAVGVPTLPAEGDGAPLELTPDGDYLLVDPVTGIRRYFTVYTENLAVLDEISDRRGNHHTFDYTEDGTPTAITHSAGYRLLLTTDEGHITALHLAGAAPDGSDQLLVTYGYDELGNLTSTTNSSGRSLRFAYDDHGRITSWTDTNNSSYLYLYDDQDRCTSQGGIEGHLRGHFSWGDPDPVTGLRTNLHHNSLGQVTTYQVNDHHQIIATTDPTGATTRTVRDAKHRVLSSTDPLGRTTHIDYDDEGRPVSVVLPDGSRSTTTYNDLGLPLTTTGPDGTTWTHTYDADGNRTSTTDPTGASTTYTHDERGHIAGVTDALGNTTRFYCDKAGLPVSVTDPLGAVTHYRRDAFGRTTSVTDPLGETTHMVWTVEGKLTTLIDATGATEEWTYDGEGNRLTHTDAIGQTTHFEYSHFDLLTARTDPDGVRHTFTHDTELRVTQVINPQGLTWNYAYDGAGRLISETDFDDRVLTYTHDAAGQLVTRTNTLGEVTAYTRDALGRIAERDAAGLVTTYAHDAAGNLYQAANSDATVTYTRDVLGRVTAETVNGRTMTFTYDALGRRTSRTTPTGHTTTYAYDAASNRTALNAGGHTLAFGHDAAGQELTRTIGDHLTLTHTWDPSGRLTTQSLTSAATDTLQYATGAAPASNATVETQRLLHRAYTYRSDGNLTAIDDSHTGRRTFDLDRVGRVTAVHAASWTEAYTYDEAGNQTHATWPDRHPNPSARGDRTYTGTNITRAGRIRYEHDALGRVTLRQKARLSRKPDTWHYTWNTEDRLTSVVTPDGTTWHYLYDPLGRRIAKRRLTAERQTIAEQTEFTWAGTNLVEETTRTNGARNAIALSWDHAGRRPIAQTERKLLDAPQAQIDQRFFAIITDLIGTPTDLVEENGNIGWRTRTTLWGSVTWTHTSTAYTPLRFPGQYFDPETELHHNYHRHYVPEAARYASPDPLGLPPAPNPATYVNNPHTWTDPLGLAPYDNPAKLYRSPHAGNRAREANGLDPALHPDTPEGGAGTAYLGDSEKVAQKYADQGVYEDGYHEYVMKPEFREAFPESHTPPYRRTHDNKADEYQWLIPREKIPKFNSLIAEVNWINYYAGITWRD
ncbi:RHS repeat-associated core domain-containing protein [Streptomyces sp. SceaMP-e96]|uniref:putative T7SS-secreted protein n=1 Tax=unclassified Streptomyces TaxID=2593676 RepID=UPI000823C218|nr:type IV secretion protein Rhs [Streptomyces sp. SID4951]SCK10964.1 RHS repeat-associated core domain-containing protein [Streptomyces sp. SceaMP-e96]